MATSHPVTPASTEVSMDKYNVLGVEGCYVPNSNVNLARDSKYARVFYMKAPVKLGSS